MIILRNMTTKKDLYLIQADLTVMAQFYRHFDTGNDEICLSSSADDTEIQRLTESPNLVCIV